ncbi:hypothetical protein Tco_0548578 [Tanacetum coccineum]
MGQAAVGPAELWRCWPRQSSIWSASGMQQLPDRYINLSQQVLVSSQHLDAFPVHPPIISLTFGVSSWQELVVVELAAKVPILVPD